MATMTKKRVAELEGAQLDWAVATAQGWSLSSVKSGVWKNSEGISVRWAGSYFPTSRWDEGGPIIEREKIWLSDDSRGNWQASVNAPVVPSAYNYWVGPTPLIAAMRAFVASKLGDEVEVPV